MMTSEYRRVKGNDLRSESHLLIRLALMVTADFDPHLPVKPFEKIEQLVRRKSAEVAVRAIRRWFNADSAGSISLSELH